MSPANSASPAPNETFEERESSRRKERIGLYDAIANWRAAHVDRHHYYSEQVRRLVGSLIPPGSRVLEVGAGLGDLLASLPTEDKIGIDVSPRMVELGRERNPGVDLRVADIEEGPLPEGPFDVVVLSDVIGHLYDIQRGMRRVNGLLTPGGRVIITYYSFLWEPVLGLAEKLGQKTPWPEQNWLSMNDIDNLLHLAGFEVVRRGTDILSPVAVPVVSDALNLVAAKLPGIKETALVQFFVARPVPEVLRTPAPSVSVVCPCRNERGNIREAVRRTPVMGPKTELLFVDGNSDDGTVEEIEAVMREYTGPLTLRLVHQGQGKGKGDAVRKGFAAAQNDILMILDSDLTVPPEDLPKFYEAWVKGKGDFINGVRLVYPMEGEAMRFLNHLGNKFFSLALSWLLEQPIKDSLCGTKVLHRDDYQRIADNRSFFGDFDPFGDFDLLFGAARLSLKIVDLPVRYRARVYGDTKISRFRDGLLLLRMTAFGFKKLRLGR